MRIALTGGGTGGHITPLVALVPRLRQQFRQRQSQIPSSRNPSEMDLVFLGPQTPHAREQFERLSVASYIIPAAKMRRYFSIRTIIEVIILLPLGFVKALYMLWFLMPDILISKGGYGSVPVVLVAWWYRIPILLHESDSTPGMANRLLARFATKIALGLPSAPAANVAALREAVHTGIPLRFTQLPDTKTARTKLELDNDVLTILISGGSQGAKQINEIVLQLLHSLITEANILHITGADHFAAVSTVAEELLQDSPYRKRYHAYPFVVEEYATLLAASDIAISRAGATSIAELALARLAVILIPLASAANDHQRRNAAVAEQAGAALVLDPDNLSPHLLERLIHDVLDNTTTRKSLQHNIQQLDRPTAARDLSLLAVDLVLGAQTTGS